jgi:hypothetical protein
LKFFSRAAPSLRYSRRPFFQVRADALNYERKCFEPDA